MKLKIIFTGIFLSVGLFPGLYAQPIIPAVKTEKVPVIDGRLNDEAWKTAARVDQVFQREPREGELASEKTIFYLCYNSSNLFIGMKCFDEPDKITAKEMAYDVSLGNDDRVQIIIDTFLDHRNGYWFQIGPRGSIGDAIVSDNGAVFNKKWDGLWDGRATIVDDGWEAEIIIPFNTLSFDENNKDWGIKLIRNIKRKLETDYWPEANLNTYRFQVSDAGILEGLDGITQGIGLDISPYLLGGMDTRRDEDNDFKLNGGLDFFYQITPSLKSSFSVNTDFAETEVDDRQINLTRFGLHFPEKRDFFLDGSNYFSFGIQSNESSRYATSIIPFFSRRMGLDQQGNPIPVNYAAKVTGQVDNWNLGLMHINDDHEYEHNFSVVRISKNIWEQSSVGLIATHGNSIGEDRNLVVGLDAKLSTSKFQGNKNLSLILFGLKSDTRNLTDHDMAFGAEVSYPNDLISFSLGHNEIGENFVAGTGFIPRNNIKATYGDFGFGPRPDKWGILQLQFGGAFNFITNFSNELRTREIKLNPMGIRFKSGEEIHYSISEQYEFLENDFNIYSDFIIPVGEYSFWRHQISCATAGSRNFWGSASVNFGDFYTGERRDYSLHTNWKVAVPLLLGANYIQNKVELPEGNFTTKIYQLSANILFSPRVTLYNYLQYDNATELLGCQSRFQWIVKPGNEILLVWNGKFNKPDNQFVLDDSALRLKLKYNIRF